MPSVRKHTAGAKNGKTYNLCKVQENKPMQFASTNGQLVPRARKQADANYASTGNWCQEQENKPMQNVQVEATGAKNKKTN